MVRVLSNEDVQELLTMEESLKALESAYRAWLRKEAGNLPRSDLYGLSTDESRVYVFKAMAGLWSQEGIAALRLNSDVITWPQGKTVKKEKLPLAPGGRWVGLVLLFSCATGQLLAIFPDGVIQKIRVGAANGLAARHLAREDASTVGLLGSGFQAEGQLEAFCAVRPIRKVKVYSPTEAHRTDFCRRFSERLHVSVEPVKTPEAAVRDADILAAATNTMEPVVDSAWLKPGVHVSTIKRQEISLDVVQGCDRVVVHVRSKGEGPFNYVALGSRGIPEQEEKGWWNDWPEASHPTLPELLVDPSRGRASPEEQTLFINNTGIGLQFAALGALVYRKAVERGKGQTLPDHWFSEDLHS
ncbi:MAG: ornithine cyclodeaminase family protein [Acidobacteria bacterium]|nr:ornithine cyclodeaminase family protein [Acidobacteriota bacterium]